jgi:hypothetical protein
MTLEAFARSHKAPPHWLELREACEGIVRQPDFWYRPDSQEQARRLAVEASEILARIMKAHGVSDRTTAKEKAMSQG